jgi:type III restriction enzyme
MARVFLQNIIEDTPYEDLPPNWNSFDLRSFSKYKTLWGYQQDAIKNALRALWKYYEDFHDFAKDENSDVNQKKKKLFDWYKDNGLEDDLSIRLDKRKRNIYSLLTEYYPYENGKISYEHFINRMCFWMATGSGKSLVIIKLIQFLRDLIRLNEIPPYDILVLTHRDDLIEQLKRHIYEFNYANTEIHIKLRDLKSYDLVKRENPTLFKDNEMTIFYYRSDNLSDEQKEKIIDFKNYDNDGKWYIFLDEAHKGDKEDGKRQQIYSILSRNGFLFNFSATFIDPRDITTTAYDFNLAKFINKGYGKHISILQQEIRAFRDDEDYSDTEKQKIVLKSLILLTYAKKHYKSLKRIQSDVYHNPLLLTLVNSVNTEDADLKLFFREIERIGKGEIKEKVWKSALSELWDELKEEPEFMFETIKVKIDERLFKGLTIDDVLLQVYNSTGTGEIEIFIRPSNRQEMAFKLKVSDKPFALIKIGDISGWLKEELVGYEINERFDDEGYFASLNQESSSINILMGSRSFYEGWDSNRPNVINFINIGIGLDAKKFILQSVGRGVRIQPIGNIRKRLLQAYNAREIAEELFTKLKDKVLPIESLFIFGTNRNALKTVIEQLENEKKKEGETELSLFLNEDAKKHKLLIPAYRLADHPLIKEREVRKFEITREDYDTLKKYADYISDDRVFLMKYDTEPEKISVLRENIRSFDNFKAGEKSYSSIDVLTQRIFNYFSVVPEEFEDLKVLREEIKHFKRIKVYLKDIDEIKRRIETVKDYPDKKKKLDKSLSKLNEEERKEFQLMLIRESEATYEYDHKRIKIKYIANHYYIPIILSDEEKIGYISNIIKTRSETRFINELADYLAKYDNKLRDFDWWMFSKLTPTDEIYIPYYNPKENKISPFYPDFIFWTQKGKNYYIFFIDPKGTEHTSAYRKIDGYKDVFEANGTEKAFNYNGFEVKIKLFLKPEDIATTPIEYRKYWFDNIDKMMQAVV